MDKSRRNLLKVGTSVAVGGLWAGSERIASAQTAASNGTQVGSVPPMSSQVGLRLATCQVGDAGAPGVVIVFSDARVVDLKNAARRYRIRLDFDPASMLSLVKSGDAGFAQVHAVAQRAAQDKNGGVGFDQVTFLSPIPRPDRNIYCVGWNYLDHFEEGKKARQDTVVEKYPEHPVFFTKGTHTMNGPFDPIPFDPTNGPLMKDWEAELAVVIGRRGRNIQEQDAMQYVFGYSAYNDTTERDIQQKRHGGQWFKGKSLDGHGPMGPWIVSAAGVNLNDVRVICRVNGVEKQNASYQQMFFKVPRIIAELSRDLTLEPGDIIATGTPSGVGFARVPQEFLHPGDVVETEITGVGMLRNPIRSEA
jgi:2-keto-4-pentenoate hydratase/2-oxohepta-3-ene-1,7-dioic acid hydratase in catechol pathway